MRKKSANGKKNKHTSTFIYFPSRLSSNGTLSFSSVSRLFFLCRVLVTWPSSHFGGVFFPHIYWPTLLSWLPAPPTPLFLHISTNPINVTVFFLLADRPQKILPKNFVNQEIKSWPKWMTLILRRWEIDRKLFLRRFLKQKHYNTQTCQHWKINYE